MGLFSTLKDHYFAAILIAGVSGIAIGYFVGNNSSTDLTSLLSSKSENLLKTSKFSRSDDALNSKSMMRRQTLMALEKAFRVSKNDLEVICDAFLTELELGLTRSIGEARDSTLPASSLPMLPSYVDRLPTGNEVGVYLAVDFGGTHVRFVKVIMDDEVHKSAGVLDKNVNVVNNLRNKFRIIQSKMIIPDDLKHGSGYDLFDYIAEGVAEFLKQHPIAQKNYKHATLSTLKKEKGGKGSSDESAKGFERTSYNGTVPLGFTFSFPVEQTGIDSGTIMRWNKDFKCDDVIGQDPVKLLQNSIFRKGVKNIKVAALVNDTVGTLIAHAYEHPQTMIGLILGTGANSSYIERTDRIEKFKPKGEIHTHHMVINTELGAFNPDRSILREENRKKILPRTRYDDVVDKASRNPGAQVYEKMISGYYLGEIVRTVLVELVESGKVFAEATWKHDDTTKYGLLYMEHSFETSYMSRIERDHSSELADTKSVFEDIFDIYDSSLSDRQLVKFICELVAIRSARLAAATIGGVLAHLGLASMLFHIRQKYNMSGESGKIVSPSISRSPAVQLISSSSDNVVVAIDGSLFEFYPHYGNRMMDALRELFGARADAIQLSLARDGSGLGAALIAAIATDKSDHGEFDRRPSFTQQIPLEEERELHR